MNRRAQCPERAESEKADMSIQERQERKRFQDSGRRGERSIGLQCDAALDHDFAVEAGGISRGSSQGTC